MDGAFPARAEGGVRRLRVAEQPVGPAGGHARRLGARPRRAGRRDRGAGRGARLPVLRRVGRVVRSARTEDRDAPSSAMLRHAGVAFGDPRRRARRSTGECVRRAGNEMLFQQLATALIATLERARRPRGSSPAIRTRSTRCRNEYPAFGGRYEVVHHTQLIARLLAEGRLRVAPQRRARHLPRAVLPRPTQRRVRGAARDRCARSSRDAPLEFDARTARRRCAAARAAARMWMEESIGTRINVLRVEQALPHAPQVIATACPYCAVMMADGISALGRTRTSPSRHRRAVAAALVAAAGRRARAAGRARREDAMTHKPRLLVHTSRQAIRWGDMDALGPRQQHRLLPLHGAGADRVGARPRSRDGTPTTAPGPVIVNASCTFVAPLVYPGELEVRMFLGDPGPDQRRQLLRDLVRMAASTPTARRRSSGSISRPGVAVPLPDRITAPLRALEAAQALTSSAALPRRRRTTMTANLPLWQPSAERIARANITAFARTRRGSGAAVASPTTRRSGAGRTTSARRSGATLWDYAGVIGERGERTLRRRRPDAGRALVSRCAAQLRREPARQRAAPTTRRTRSCSGARTSEQRRVSHARAPSTVASRVAAALRARGRGRRRSRRRVHAEHARGDRRDARRDVAAARSGRRARRTSACRACSTASARSSRACSSPSTATGTTARRSPILDKVAEIVAGLPTVERVVVVPYLERSGGPLATSRRRSAARVRWDDFLAPHAAGPIEFARLPFDHPALHPVLVGHDRRAEVHRPRRGRHAAAAPEGAPAARRRAGPATACSTSRPAAG